MQRKWMWWALFWASSITFGCDDSAGRSAQQQPCGDLEADVACLVGTLELDGSRAADAASVSVLGQPAGTVKSGADGVFALPLDRGLSPIITSGTKASASDKTITGSEYTLVMHKPADGVGRVVKAVAATSDTSKDSQDGGVQDVIDVGTVKLQATGNIRGEVTLAGATDHTGIQVYLPGTSYLATTAVDGRFALSDVPPGVFPFLRAEKDGYNFAIVSDVDVPSGGTVTLPPLSLGIDTGAEGTVEFVGATTDAEGVYATDSTVVLRLVASDDAVLVMVSEDKNFEGASWQPIQTQISHTFDGDGTHTVYVKFANANGLETAPISATITIDTDPRVQVLSPSGSTTHSLPTIDWTDTRITDATYRLQIARDPLFEDVVLDVDRLTESTFTLDEAPLAADGSYYVRVVVDDGQPRSWSDTDKFTVDFGEVSLLSPQGAQPSSRPTLDWSEPVLESPSYHVQLADDTEFSAPMVDVTDIQSSEYTITTTLTPGQEYYFRVAVKDENDVEAAFSTAQAFSVDLGTVAIDSLGSPEPDSTPTLTWSTSSLPSVTYHVQIAADPSFTTLVDEATDLTDAAYTVSVLENGKSYYARVAVVDRFGAQGSWAGPSNFSVEVGSVDLQLPADDDLTNNTTPTFSWNANSTAASYILTYGTDSGLSGGTEVADIADAAYTLATALPDTALTTYYWAVTPVDESGVLGTRSEIRSFRLDTQAPTGTFAINDGDATTYDEMVRAQFKGTTDQSGPVEMLVTMVDPDPTASWGGTSTPTVLDYVDLASTDTATITAYGYLRDAAGNVSSQYTDTIALNRTLIPGATISSDTTWAAAQSPFYITSNVLVQHPATLTIEPGATVYFKSGTKIEVRSGGHSGEAGLSAVGSSGAPIVLSGALIQINYAADWIDGGRIPTYDGSGNYVQGPHFDYVTMADGTIHVSLSTFDGPGFYMRHSTLQTVNADFFGYVLGGYIEHSTVATMGDASQPLNLDGSQVLNSYVGSMQLDGYSYADGVKVERCEVNTLVIDRWVPAKSSLAYNRIGTLTWNRPSTTNTAELHNNTFIGSGTLLTVGADTGGSGANLNATGNYWGASATSEMDANQQNITMIHDFYDDTNLVIVDYSGYFATPVVGAGPDW